jgi:uncharacterized protein
VSKAVPVRSVSVARNPWTRLVGMLGRQNESNVRILFPMCASVHTCFMRIPIDVVFLDRRNVVVKIVSPMNPWRFVSGGRGAESVLEGNAGFVVETGLSVGDKVEWQSD